MENSIILTRYLELQNNRLAVFRQYQQHIDNPYVKSALSFVIEDTQEAIARISSRLRQLGQSSTIAAPENLGQAFGQQELADQLRFVHRSLKEQLEWYDTQTKTLLNDADTQAILVALAEQTRVRLERWENLMDELKVLPEK